METRNLKYNIHLERPGRHISELRIISKMPEHGVDGSSCVKFEGGKLIVKDQKNEYQI